MVERWAAYLAIEPDVGTRLDVMLATVAASNLWPHQKKGRKTKPRDLMPRWGRTRRGRSGGMHLLAWATSQGATVDPKLAEKLMQ